MESQLETTQTVSALKLLVLKTRKYDLWSMRMEQYLTFTNHALWEVIINGDLVSPVAISVLVYESEIKGQTSSSSNSQNVAFVSSNNSSITNETFNTAHSIFDASFKDQASTASYADDVMFSFFANQSNALQLDIEDLEQIDADDFEEMDLKWQVAMLTMRVKRFTKRLLALTGERLNATIIGESEMVHSMFNSRESDVDDNPVNDRFKIGEGFHAVPPPYTGNYMPPRPDLSFARLDESVFKSAVRKTTTSVPETDTTVATKSGQVQVNAAKQSSSRAATSISTARPVNTDAPKPKGNPQYTLQDQGIFNSGCSRHMTGNSIFLQIIKRLMVDLLHLEEVQRSSDDAVADDAGKKTTKEPANKGERNGQEKEGGASNKEGRKALYGLQSRLLEPDMSTLSTYLLENYFDEALIKIDIFNKKDNGDILYDARDSMLSAMRAHFLLRVVVKTTSTPIDTNKALLKDKEAKDVYIHLYRSMIRSFMYLTTSRPDIMFAVCACARYLKGQPKLGLWYLRDSPFDFEAFSDSDYVGASLDRKSTIGGCQFLGKSDEFGVKTGSCKVNKLGGFGANAGQKFSMLGKDNIVVRAATTATSLEAEQENDAQTRFETASKQSHNPPLSKVNTSGSGEDSMEHQNDLTDFIPPTPHDSPLLGGHTPGSDDGRPNINELMAICTNLSNRVLALETSKTAQDLVINKLKKKVKRLEKKQRSRTPGVKLFKIGTSRRKSLDKRRHIMKLVGCGWRVWSGSGCGRELFLGEEATRALPNMGFNLVYVESVWLSLLGDEGDVIGEDDCDDDGWECIYSGGKRRMIFLTQTDKIAVSNGANQSTLQAALAINFLGDEIPSGAAATSLGKS
ncbi:hypothetical protein Tco_1226701 [Tanacetum coccineum]